MDSLIRLEEANISHGVMIADVGALMEMFSRWCLSPEKREARPQQWTGTYHPIEDMHKLPHYLQDTYDFVSGVYRPVIGATDQPRCRAMWRQARHVDRRRHPRQGMDQPAGCHLGPQGTCGERCSYPDLLETWTGTSCPLLILMDPHSD